MGSKHKRKESISARIALLKPADDSVIRREIGEETWVQDEKRGERVAMLRLPTSALPNSKLRRSFDRQLKALDGFAHPNVVEVLEGGTNDGEGHGFLISKLVEGQTLREALGDAPLPPQDAIGIAIDLLNALSAGHWRWLVHGGLAPESILIEPEDGRPRARILHYGFAPVVGETRETSFGEAQVSLDYAAPEAIKGEPVDPRADVYSVGVLLFEMVTGRHPVPATGNDPVRSRVLDQADALPSDALADSDLHARLKSALKRALQKDPSQRFCSARSFALALSGEPLPSEDPFEDPWAWPEACPEGGVCASSGATIPPLEDRTWTRKQSDRPFRCRVTGKDYAGSEQWDNRGLCSRGARHRPLPAPEGEAPEDVIYDDLLDAPEVADAPSETAKSEPAAESEPSAKDESAAKDEASPSDTEKLDRRAAILELLKDDSRMAGFVDEGDARPAPVAAPSDDEALVMDPVPPKSERDRSSSGRDLSDSTSLRVEEAFLDAWDGAKRQTEAATTRMKRATRSAERPGSGSQPSESDAAAEEPTRSESPRPVGRPLSYEPAVVVGDPFRWQVGAGVLAIVVLMIGLRLNQEIETSQGLRNLRASTDKKLQDAQEHNGELYTKLRAREGEVKGLEHQVRGLDSTLGTERKKVAALTEETGGLKRDLKASQHLAATRAAELERAKAAGQKLEKDLAASREEIKVRTRELAAAQAGAVALEARATEISKQLEARTKAGRELEAALAQERGALAKLQGRLTQVTLSRDEGVAALAKAKTELGRLQAAKGTLEQALGESRATEAARSRELAAMRVEREAIRSELAQKSETTRRMASEIRVLQGRNAELTARVKELEGSLAKLKRERSDLMVELADLAAEREQLDAEGLQLERWLRESEARNRNAKGGGATEQVSKLRLRSVGTDGKAQDAPSGVALTLGERGLAVVESAAMSSVLEKAKAGEVLLTVRLRSKGGPPVLKLQGFLSAARVDRPTAAGIGVRLEKVGPDEYRAWLKKSLLARYKPVEGSAGFGLLLVGGANPSQVSGVELRASALSEDARALLEQLR